MQPFDHVIIGGGLAGAAAAYWLTRLGATGVLVIEREPTPGVHASGRNAAMIRQVVPGAATSALAREGAAFIRDTASRWDPPVRFDRNGSLLLASGEKVAALKRDMAEAAAAGLEVAWLSPAECRQKCGALEDAEFEGGLWCPSDGVVDVAALLQGYLREARKAGAQVWTNCEVFAFEVEAGRCSMVHTTEGLAHPKSVIDAAGAWAADVAGMAGASRIPMRALRRHLYVTAEQPGADSRWPFVWDVSKDYYFRPEPPGLLLCACDEDEQPPGIPPEDPEVERMLAEKFSRFVPRLADARIAHKWAGLRTFAPDHHFVIGPDPQLEGFFWAAALGGHGVTTSAAVGRMIAELVLGKRASVPEEFSPERFVEHD